MISAFPSQFPANHPASGSKGEDEKIDKNCASQSGNQGQPIGNVNRQTKVTERRSELESKSKNHTWFREARRHRLSMANAEPRRIPSNLQVGDYHQPDLRTPIKRAKQTDVSPCETEEVGRSAKIARLSERSLENNQNKNALGSSKNVKTRSKMKRVDALKSIKSIKQSILPDLWHPSLIQQNNSPAHLFKTVQTKLEETRKQTVEFRRNLDELRKKFEFSSRQRDPFVQPTTVHTTGFNHSTNQVLLTDLKLWHLSSLFDHPNAPNWKTLSVICNSQFDCESSVHDEDLVAQIDCLAGFDPRVSVYLVLLFWTERCSNPIVFNKLPTLECLLDLLRTSGYETFASFCLTHMHCMKPW